MSFLRFDFWGLNQNGGMAETGSEAAMTA